MKFFNKPTNYIVIRETLDWRNATYDDLRDDAIRIAARFWDDAFKLSFIECRARIKEVSESTLQVISGVTIIGENEFLATNFRDDDLILICDDDDWYHPNIFKILRKSNLLNGDIALWPDGVYGYHVIWRPSTEKKLESHLETLKSRPLDDANAFSAVKTNNYALTGKFLNENSAMRNAVIGHASAADSLINEERKITYLDTPLSAVNRHPCSYLILTKLLENKPLKEILVAFVKDYVESDHLKIQEEFQWVTPHIEEIKVVFKEALENSA